MSDAAGTAGLTDAELAIADTRLRHMWSLLNGMAAAKHAVLRTAHEGLHRIGADTRRQVEADVHVAAGHTGPMLLCREQTCGYAWAAIDQLCEASERLR